MRTLILLFLLALRPVWGQEYRDDVAFVWMREGVTAGFAPKPITREILVVQPRGQATTIYRKRRLADGKYEFHRASGDFQEVSERLDYLGLFALPQGTEMDDIYKLQTGLLYHADGKSWKHEPPSGCVSGHSKVQPTEAQRKTFEAVVDHMISLIGKGQPCTAEEFEKARESIYQQKA